MKKIFYFIASAIVALGAVACQNDIDENIDNNQQTEGLSIKVTIDEQTRVELGNFEEGKGYKLSFEEGDVLVARAESQSGTSYLFECTKAEGDVYTFTCTAEGVSSLVGTKPCFFYLGGLHEQAKELTIYGAFCNTAAEDLSGIGLYASKYDFDHNNKNLGEEGHMVSLHALPLLKFTANEPVTFQSTNRSQFFVNGWADSYTTKKTGEIYLPIMPSGGECTVTVTTESGFNKTFTTMFEENKIYNLGTIEAPVATIGIVGSFQGWDVAKPVAMTHKGDGWIVARGVELYKVDEFKFVEGNSWDVSFGNKDSVLKAETDKEYTLVQGGQNIKATKNGKFDIYFNPETKAFKYTVAEEYTNLMVNITINNKANWSPLYITLKSGDTTIADNATVTGNKYAISGNYIGEDLSYTLSNGSKNSTGSINISKTGATITLEETVIKLKITLNTDNAQKWWGNTMKIHAWGTGTSFDTSWPGNNMTFEGNYTWSVIVPSELVGKTINYLVHNGNGWQSSDSKVTIKAEGNTVNGSAIGIN